MAEIHDWAGKITKKEMEVQYEICPEEKWIKIPFTPEVDKLVKEAMDLDQALIEFKKMIISTAVDQKEIWNKIDSATGARLPKEVKDMISPFQGNMGMVQRQKFVFYKTQ